MKLLTIKDVESLKFKEKKGRRSDKNPITIELLSMRVGDAMMITKQEWFLKSPPVTALYSEKYKKFSSRTLADNSGWVITRIQ